MIWRVMVVLPEDSGPKTSITRPRGKPPTPRAASKLMEPVEMTEIGSRASLDPRRTMEPLPNCFSIWERASSTALARSSIAGMAKLLQKEWLAKRDYRDFQAENTRRHL